MDGLFSALFAYNQLKKQGIDPEKIKLHGTQYGEKDEIKEYGKTKKGQALIVVDFAALPSYAEEYKLAKEEFDELKSKTRKTKYEEDKIVELEKKVAELKLLSDKESGPKTKERAWHKPDFVSDHHDNSKKDLISGRGGKIGTKFPSDSEHIAVSYANNIVDSTTVEAVSRIDSANYTRLLDTMDMPTNFKEKGRMERLAIIVNSLIGRLFKKDENLINYVIRNANPSLVSVYTTISKAIKLSDLQSTGLEELSKEKPDWSKIDKIRKELPTELTVEKEKIPKSVEKFGSAKKETQSMREKGKEDLKTAVKGSFTPKEMEELKNAKESLNTVRKSLNDYDDSSNLDQADKEELANLKSELDDILRYMRDDKNFSKENMESFFGARRDKVISLIKSLEDKSKKISASGGKKDLLDKKAKIDQLVSELELKKKAKPGAFHPINPLVLRQDAVSTRGYPGRFTGQVLSRGGKRFPFLLKRYNTMIQVSVNPDISKENKEKINLINDMKEMMVVIKKKYMTKYNKWSFDVIDKESGGHAGITNISGASTLGLMVKAKRDRFKELKTLEDRAKKVGMNIETKMPKLYAEIEQLKKERDIEAEKRKEILNNMEIEFYRIMKEKYRDISVEKEQSEKYELPKKEESFKDLVNNLLKD